MKKIFALLLTVCLVFSACSNGSSNPNNNASEKPPFEPDASSTEETPEHNREDATINTKSFVEGLAYNKAEEIGMMEATEEEAIKLAYDYLVAYVYFADPIGLDVWRYYTDNPDDPISFIENRSLSPFMFNIGSCEDFAAAMTMLLNARGIPALYVAGFTLSKDQVYIDHAWAMVTLDGVNYHLDPQLEHNIISNGKIKYRFFMKTDDEMFMDHKWGSNLVDYWPDMPVAERETILNEFTYPLCTNAYPATEAKTITPPPTPDYNAIYNEIDEIKKTKELAPIQLNVEPPILVAKYHITPALTNNDASSTPVSSRIPYGKSTLDPTQQKLYDRILSQFSSHNLNSFYPNESLEREDVVYTIKQVLNDNPTLYWARIDYDDTINEITLSYKQYYDRRIVNDELSQLEHKLAKITPPISGSTDFEKALFAHNYLAENVRYDAGFKGTDSDNPFGAIVDNVAYCDGYARGFQFLVDYLGVENIYVAGRNTKSATHAWNAVKLDGEWYYVDVTWDRSSNSYGGSYHDFFAVTADECFDSRIWDDTQYTLLPKATATDNNFYIKYDYTIGSDYSDIKKLRERIANIANRQLLNKDNLKNDYSYSFAEFKVVADKDQYITIKNYITKELFYILEAMEEDARNNNYGFSVSYDSEVSCYFNDSLQIVAFYPKVKKINN